MDIRENQRFLEMAEEIRSNTGFPSDVDLATQIGISPATFYNAIKDAKISAKTWAKIKAASLRVNSNFHHGGNLKSGEGISNWTHVSNLNEEANLQHVANLAKEKPPGEQLYCALPCPAGKPGADPMRQVRCNACARGLLNAIDTLAAQQQRMLEQQRAHMEQQRAYEEELERIRGELRELLGEEE